MLWLVDDGTVLEEGDDICVIEDKNVSSEYDEAVRSLEDAQANLGKVRANHQMQLAMLEAQIKTNNAETMIAGLDSLQLKYSSDNQRKIKELELQRTAIEKARFDKKIHVLHQIQTPRPNRFSKYLLGLLYINYQPKLVDIMRKTFYDFQKNEEIK